MRVGVLFREDTFNAIYRAAALADALAARRIPVEVVVHRDDPSIDVRRLLRCDVVHIYRRAEPNVRACVDELRKRGIAIVWDNDDDIRMQPPDGGKISKFRAQADFKEQVRMIKRSDIVTTTSEVLAGIYRQAGAQEVRTVENYLLPHQRATPAPSDGSIVVGWVAADEHRADARELDIVGVLRQAMQRHPEVRVETVGLRLGGLDSTRYRHERQVYLLDLKDRMRSWDIGIAPLADHPMSYARSNVKVKEYAAAGVPWVASARGPYVGLGPDQGGILVADADWSERLERLVTTPAMRAALRERAQRWGASQTIDRHLDKWLKTWEDAIAFARRRGTPTSDVNAP